MNKKAVELLEAFNKKNCNSGYSKKGYGLCYFANRKFNKGEVVMKGVGKPTDHQTSFFSVQIDTNKHFIPKKWTGKYWNHSCDPNCYMRSSKGGFPELVASRAINKNEEITYAYYMSEYQWTKKAAENYVPCLCGEKNCCGKIRSFSDLSVFEKRKIIRQRKSAAYLRSYK